MGKTMEECKANIANNLNPDGTPKGVNCGDGLIVPIWRPYTKLTGGDRFGRGLLYVVLMVKVWNETVANLSLMALGSSAPEILLSVVEIWAKGFKAGDLGPGTIVGSAAFNLFMIIGLCMYVIPDDEVRKIKHLRVFIVTATWSVFAYVWLYLILAPISRGVVESRAQEKFKDFEEDENMDPALAEFERNRRE